MTIFTEGFLVYFFILSLVFLGSFPYYFLSFSMTSLLVFDGPSFFMVFLTFFVLYISYFFSFSLVQSSLTDLVFFSTLIPCFFVFFVRNGLLLYISYEVSLLPILYIIVKWGSYSERSLRALMLLVYTRIFSFPLMVGLFYLYTSTNTFSLLVVLPSFSSPLFLSLLIFFSFSFPTNNDSSLRFKIITLKSIISLKCKLFCQYFFCLDIISKVKWQRRNFLNNKEKTKWKWAISADW